MLPKLLFLSYILPSGRLTNILNMNISLICFDFQSNFLHVLYIPKNTLFNHAFTPVSIIIILCYLLISGILKIPIKVLFLRCMDSTPWFNNSFSNHIESRLHYVFILFCFIFLLSTLWLLPKPTSTIHKILATGCFFHVTVWAWNCVL